MTLPVTNLDDRTFQDLVDEAKRKIPKHCPEWTNHNVSDPGVALIELFAWMTEMTLFRLNQVPDVYYTSMLNLVGFERFPATAARADLTFWLVAPTEEPVAVPAGTQVGTAGELGDARVFTTLADLTIAQPAMTASLTSSGPDSYVDVWEALRLDTESVVCFPRSPMAPGDAFFLGFERSLAGNVIRLDLTANVQGIGVIPDRPPLRWEVWQGEGWAPATIHLDTTGGLNRDGALVLLVPAEHEPLTLGGQRAYWLRARLLAPEPGQPGYRASPQVRRVRATSMGGTVVAEHSDTTEREFLGTSTGQPDQRFALGHTPVLPRMPGEVVEVTHDGLITEWTEVSDFADSHEHDTHVVWDAVAGEVHFGPIIRYPDGTTRQHGAIPRAGARIGVTRYRFGGGGAGNVGANTLTALRTTIPFVDRVQNLHAAAGGVDAEAVENAKRRGPYALRSGARAVTVSDFERLTREADPAIARVRCLAPARPGQPVRLLLVPTVDRPDPDLVLDDFALPNDMIGRVSEFLDERRILGVDVEVGTPYYQGVTVAALVTARAGRPPTIVRDRVLAMLYRYLSPLNGGVDGEGWAFDTDLNAASIVQLVRAVEGVERVEEVLFFEYDLRNHERLGLAREQLRLERDSLFLSANHQVVVR